MVFFYYEYIMKRLSFLCCLDTHCFHKAFMILYLTLDLSFLWYLGYHTPSIFLPLKRAKSLFHSWPLPPNKEFNGEEVVSYGLLYLWRVIGFFSFWQVGSELSWIYCFFKVFMVLLVDMKAIRGICLVVCGVLVGRMALWRSK